MAGGSCPDGRDFHNLKGEFDTLISLLDDERQYLYSPDEASALFRWHNVPMRDHATPSLGQLAELYDILWSLPESSKTLVHCLAGIGRTGTVAASYLVLKGLDVDEALERVAAWTGGYFVSELNPREAEVRDLLNRFKKLFRDEGSAASGF